MSTLTDRLRSVVGGAGAVPRVAPDASAPLVPATSGATGVDLARAAETLGGEVTHLTAGAAIAVDRYYAPTAAHGRVTIGDIVDILEDGRDALATLTAPGALHPVASPGGLESPRDPTSRPGSASRGLWFLDLETTGLAGGAGTQAFLVGCACLEAGGMRVRQFLLPGFEHEPALLTAFAEWAADRGAIVSFNGRSFDVPLIETRFLFHRQRFPLEGRAHVDMLHPARRLWRARGEWDGASEASCSLGTLEKLLAGVHRVGDVPGFEIPSRYFQFVRDGDARPLEAVLEHNRLDLISLALVMAHALMLIEQGPSRASSAYECLGLARIYDRAGRRDEAEVSYRYAIERLARVGRDPETLAEAWRRLAYCRRRAGRWHDAAAAWQQVVDMPRCPPALRHEASEALAIYHEHRVRNLDAAHAHAQVLLRGPGSRRQREAAAHRLQRLERKRSGAHPPPRLWGLEPDA